VLMSLARPDSTLPDRSRVTEGESGSRPPVGCFGWTMAGRLPRVCGSRLSANKLISDDDMCSTRSCFLERQCGDTRTLDLGSGEGRFCRMLKQHGIQVRGVYPIRGLLEATRARYGWFVPCAECWAPAVQRQCLRSGRQEHTDAHEGCSFVAGDVVVLFLQPRSSKKLRLQQASPQDKRDNRRACSGAGEGRFQKALIPKACRTPPKLRKAFLMQQQERLLADPARFRTHLASSLKLSR
jgi:hypothetical protein